MIRCVNHVQLLQPHLNHIKMTFYQFRIHLAQVNTTFLSIIILQLLLKYKNFNVSSYLLLEQRGWLQYEKLTMSYVTTIIYPNLLECNYMCYTVLCILLSITK